jgi:6-phosphogluconolactonase
MPESKILISGPDGAVAEAVIYPDTSSLITGAADLIGREAIEAIAQRGRFAVTLSGGNTPKPIYERLAKAAGIDWTRVQIFFGDERCVPPGDQRSNYNMAKAALLDHVSIPPGNVHRMHGEEDPETAAADYRSVLERALGTEGRFDLVLLGLGDNGHTASLFPGLAAVTEANRTVMALYVEVIGMWRLTLTPPIINAARRVAFLAEGSGKAEVLYRVLQGPRQPIVLPAQAIRPTEQLALWLIDAAAAGKLQRPA